MSERGAAIAAIRRSLERLLPALDSKPGFSWTGCFAILGLKDPDTELFALPA